MQLPFSVGFVRSGRVFRYALELRKKSIQLDPVVVIFGKLAVLAGQDVLLNMSVSCWEFCSVDSIR